MSEELKPCPFCGGSAQESFADFHDGGHVKCSECGVTGPVWSNDTQDAVNAWNIRASNTLTEEQAARIAELEAEVQRRKKREDQAGQHASHWKIECFAAERKLDESQARLSEAVKVLEELGTAVSIYRLGVKDTVPKIAAGDPGDMATINALMANNGILDAALSQAKAFITTLGGEK